MSPEVARALDVWLNRFKERQAELYPSQGTRRALERAEAELAAVLERGQC
jgi:hypothetical protein